MEEKQAREFLSKYEELCREYGLLISGCGCCGSPWVADLKEEKQLTENCDHLIGEVMESLKPPPPPEPEPEFDPNRTYFDIETVRAMSRKEVRENIDVITYSEQFW